MGLWTVTRSEQSSRRCTIGRPCAAKPFYSARGAIIILTGVACLCARPARGQALAEQTSREQARTRTEVVLGVVGLHAEALRVSLVGLLQAELSELSLSLVERSPSREVSAWASEAVRSERALLAVLLDARSDRGWRLVVIDAARGRAIVRDLPGGIQQDAASIEAVVSIAVSAASALREGLEVASSPLEAVVGDSPAQTQSSRRTVTSDPVEPAPSPAHGRRWILRGSLGAGVASFSPEKVATTGIALALGVDWHARLEARVFGTWFWPASIHTALGEFEVNRALLGVAAGPILKLRTFSLIPEAGVVTERLQRSETTPAAGVLATEGQALYRIGGALALRLRLPLIRPLSAELVAGAAYFGRRVQFATTGPAATQLAEVWPVAAFVQLGLDAATQ